MKSRNIMALVVVGLLAACGGGTGPEALTFEGSWRADLRERVFIAVTAHEDGDGKLTGSGAVGMDTTVAYTFTIDGARDSSSVNFTCTSDYLPFYFSGVIQPTDHDVVNGAFRDLGVHGSSTPVSFQRQ